jgi:hypothetical protein
VAELFSGYAEYGGEGELDGCRSEGNGGCGDVGWGFCWRGCVCGVVGDGVRAGKRKAEESREAVNSIFRETGTGELQYHRVRFLCTECGQVFYIL